MKESLKNAHDNYVHATQALKKVTLDIAESKGPDGFSFGEFHLPTVIDALPKPIEAPYQEHRLEAIRINGDEVEGKVEGWNDWFPLSFDEEDAELIISVELLSACMLATLGA
jgi:hypothetical protein